MIFNKKFIPYGRQTITRGDINEVVRTMKSDFITQGPKVVEFEEIYLKFLRLIQLHAIALLVLCISCLALNLKPEDSVWTSPISFVASANCLYCGAKIDFIDINPETGLMDENLLEEKLEIASKIILYLKL